MLALIALAFTHTSNNKDKNNLAQINLIKLSRDFTTTTRRGVGVSLEATLQVREKFAVGVAAPLLLLLLVVAVFVVFVVVVVVVGLVEVCRFIGLLVFDFVFGSLWVSKLKLKLKLEVESELDLESG